MGQVDHQIVFPLLSLPGVALPFFQLQQMVEEFYPILSPAGKTAHVHVPEDLILPGDPDKLARKTYRFSVGKLKNA